MKCTKINSCSYQLAAPVILKRESTPGPVYLGFVFIRMGGMEADCFQMIGVIT